MLTASELAQLRADVSELLPDTCRIERPTTGNTNGYPTETWGTAVTSAACRFDPENRQSPGDAINDKETGIAYYQVTLAYNADVADGDRLIYSGGTYQVTQLYEAHSNRLVKHLRASIIRGA